MSNTIAAISTPLGEGGIGTVRISGDGARAVADRVFKSKSGKRIENAAGYTALYGGVYHEGEKLDDAVALIFAAPKSYTGEDVVELSCHGGSFVTRALLRAVLSAGACPAGPGEFTRRAYENRKLDLAEAESVMAIISAAGEQELKIAIAAKDGRISKEIEEIKNRLLTVDAGMAVFADYPDDDLPEADAHNVHKNLTAVRDSLSRLLRNFDAGKLIREGVKTAIIGAPNVGKSTLMNMLAGEHRSIVTSVAGTTRDIIEETVRVGDVTLRLADTAGVRETADEVERIGVSLACKRAEDSQLIIAVLDGARALSADDRQILSLIEGRRALIVINKTDLPSKLQKNELPAVPTVEISAERGEGREELARVIAQVSGAAFLDPDCAVLSTERQRSCAARALDGVCEAIATLESGFTLDAVGICAEEALSALLELTGERVTNAVADEVFSRFCVGK